MSRANVSLARVLAANVGASLAKTLEDHRREVMATAATRFVRARNENERRSARHHQKTRVRYFRGQRARATLRNLDSTSNEVGRVVTQPRGFVFTASPLSEAFRRFVASVHQPR